MVVDEFLRCSFVSFLKEKSKAIEILKSLFNRIQVEIGHPIVRIRVIKGKSLTIWILTSFVNQKELNMSF